MKRNPFKKEDNGCSFVCFLLSQLLIQVVFYNMIIHTCFVKDHVETLKEIAIKRGLKIDEETHNLDQQKHEYLLPDDDPLLQREGIISSDKLWIRILLFYIFSLFWYIAYFKLIFTDISCPSNFDETNSNASYSDTLLCKKCKVMRRSDVYHCFQCGVCSELHDHHCDVIQVCICAKNYKYFILFVAYASLECVTAIFSMI